MGTFLNAVKNLINSLTAKTGSTASTADMVQLHDANGTPNGKISLANLASVLGGFSSASKPSSITDLDSMYDLTRPTIYTWVGASSCPSNAPFSNSAGHCLIIPTYYGAFQIACRNQANFGAIYFREYWAGSMNSWFPWKSVTLT